MAAHFPKTISKRLSRNRLFLKNPWLEVAYRCERMGHYLHWMGDRTGAKGHVKRLERLVELLKPASASILGQTARALLAEMHGDWETAAEHRLKAAQLTAELYATTNPDRIGPQRRVDLDANHRHVMIARLRAAKGTYEKRGMPAGVIKKIDRAIAVMEKSKEPWT